MSGICATMHWAHISDATMPGAVWESPFRLQDRYADLRFELAPWVRLWSVCLYLNLTKKTVQYKNLIFNQIEGPIYLKMLCVTTSASQIRPDPTTLVLLKQVQALAVGKWGLWKLNWNWRKSRLLFGLLKLSSLVPILWFAMKLTGLVKMCNVVAICVFKSMPVGGDPEIKK